MGTYLLRRNSSVLPEHVLDYLVRLLTEPVTVDEHQVPGHWAHDSPRGHYDEDWPAARAPELRPRPRRRWAHRAPCAVRTLGRCRPCHTALDEGCRVLFEWARPVRGGGTGWPEMLALGPSCAVRFPGASPGGPPWCYGTAGIVPALQLAALAVTLSATVR